MSTLIQSAPLSDLPVKAGFHPLLAILACASAVREAMTAMRRYEHDRALGVSHADAITRAFKAG